MFSIPTMLVVGCSSKTDTRCLTSICPFGGIPYAAIVSAELSPLGWHAAPVNPVPLVPPLDPYVSPLTYSPMPPSSSTLDSQYYPLCPLTDNPLSSASSPITIAQMAFPTSSSQSLLWSKSFPHANFSPIFFLCLSPLWNFYVSISPLPHEI